MNAADCPPGVFLALPDRPPAGIRLAVKDLFDTAGLVTTYGSPLFAAHLPTRTAARRSRLSRPWATASSGRRTCTSSRTERPRRTPTSASSPTHSRRAGSQAGRAAGTPPRSSSVRPTSPSAPTPADRFAFRLRAAASSASSRRSGSSRSKAASRLPRASTTPGRWRETCAVRDRPSRRSSPGYEPRRLESLEEVVVGVAWTDDASPLVRARVVGAS